MFEKQIHHLDDGKCANRITNDGKRAKKITVSAHVARELISAIMSLLGSGLVLDCDVTVWKFCAMGSSFSIEEIIEPPKIALMGGTSFIIASPDCLHADKVARQHNTEGSLFFYFILSKICSMPRMHALLYCRV